MAAFSALQYGTATCVNLILLFCKIGICKVEIQKKTLTQR